MVGKIPRVIGDNCDAVIDRKWDIPPIFAYLQKLGPVSKKEMVRVFNMGIGYVLVVSPSFTRSIMTRLKNSARPPISSANSNAAAGKWQ